MRLGVVVSPTGQVTLEPRACLCSSSRTKTFRLNLVRPPATRTVNPIFAQTAPGARDPARGGLPARGRARLPRLGSVRRRG